MNVEKRANIIKDWIENYCKNESFQPKTLVVGISGGIDSSVVSTLCALTGRKTIVFLFVKAQRVLTTDESIPPDIPTTNDLGLKELLSQYLFIQSTIIFALFSTFIINLVISFSGFCLNDYIPIIKTLL